MTRKKINTGIKQTAIKDLNRNKESFFKDEANANASNSSPLAVK